MENYNPFSLTDKTILITGASSGIGRQTAIECSKLGAKVIITARNEERLKETLSQMEGDGHQYIIADLTDTLQMYELVDQSGNIDGLVLCSGKSLTLPFKFSSREKFDDLFETNFFAPIELMRLLYKKKKIKKGASIVILASLGGTEIFSGSNGIYGASKAALNAIMRFCAKEFSQRMVRVNSICPGMVDTPLIHRGTISEEQLQLDAQRYPLKRYGQPTDIAYAAIYMLSDAASWTTGQSLIIDGGISIK